MLPIARSGCDFTPDILFALGTACETLDTHCGRGIRYKGRLKSGPQVWMIMFLLFCLSILTTLPLLPQLTWIILATSDPLFSPALKYLSRWTNRSQETCVRSVRTWTDLFKSQIYVTLSASFVRWGNTCWTCEVSCNAQGLLLSPRKHPCVYGHWTFAGDCSVTLFLHEVGSM